MRDQLLAIRHRQDKFDAYRHSKLLDQGEISSNRSQTVRPRAIDSLHFGDDSSGVLYGLKRLPTDHRLHLAWDAEAADWYT